MFFNVFVYDLNFKDNMASQYLQVYTFVLLQALMIFWIYFIFTSKNITSERTNQCYIVLITNDSGLIVGHIPESQALSI